MTRRNRENPEQPLLFSEDGQSAQRSDKEYRRIKEAPEYKGWAAVRIAGADITEEQKRRAGALVLKGASCIDIVGLVTRERGQALDGALSALEEEWERQNN
jgi:hypothetical protein